MKSGRDISRIASSKLSQRPPEVTELLTPMTTLLIESRRIFENAMIVNLYSSSRVTVGEG
jgi:hypothetical protein